MRVSGDRGLPRSPARDVLPARLMVSVIASVLLVALLLAACGFDVRVRRIPNALTMAGLVAVLVLRAFLGVGAVFEGLAGAGIAMLMALPPFALGMLGGGDAKLLAVVGGFMGLDHVVGALLAIAVLGGALAIVEAVRRRVLAQAIGNTVGFAKQWLFLGRFGATPTIESPNALTVPYGVAIAAGALMWWFLAGVQL